MKTIHATLDVPARYREKVRFVLDFFSAAWGSPVRVVECPDESDGPRLRYSSAPEGTGRAGELVVPFDSTLYDPATVCEVGVVDGWEVWAKKGCGQGGLDLIGSTFRLLTLLDEGQVDPASRDSLKSPRIGSLPQGRQAAVRLPLVDHQAALLLGRLIAATPDLRGEVLPRWPGGHEFAVCVTHDADSMFLGHPRELAANLAKWLLRRRKIFLEMAVEGLRQRRAKQAGEAWGIPGWRTYEDRCGVRSCFFLAVPPLAGRRRLNDCKSHALAAGVDWGPLREMHSGGWEFGLHPALNAQLDPAELRLGKEAVENRLGAQIRGLRHHYLAINHLEPHLSFRAHVDAGFAYDSSLGWREGVGFRSGTALPFNPFDPVREAAFELIEIPLMVMDAHVMSSDLPDTMNSVQTLVERVRRLGGLVTLDWHAETYWNRLLHSGYRTMLGEVLAPLLQDDTAWFATPSQITDWWLRRQAVLRGARSTL